MKKFLVLICMIACVLGMTACESEQTYTEHEQQKLDGACKMAEEYVGMIQEIVTRLGADYFDEFTAEEVEYQLSRSGLQVDGYAFVKALESFSKANAEIGGPGTVTGTEAVFDKKQIIVTVHVQGDISEATAEVVLSNDMFFRLESASLNKVSTMNDNMEKAAMNTLLGMGSVFTVLVLISLIIFCFNIIPAIQSLFSGEKSVTAGIEKAVARIAEQEENLADDLELAAVIAAAVAASEGAASTDGFVVRSIIRRA